MLRSAKNEFTFTSRVAIVCFTHPKSLLVLGTGAGRHTLNLARACRSNEVVPVIRWWERNYTVSISLHIKRKEHTSLHMCRCLHTYKCNVCIYRYYLILPCCNQVIYDKLEIATRFMLGVLFVTAGSCPMMFSLAKHDFFFYDCTFANLYTRTQYSA